MYAINKKTYYSYLSLLHRATSHEEQQDRQRGKVENEPLAQNHVSLLYQIEGLAALIPIDDCSIIDTRH